MTKSPISSVLLLTILIACGRGDSGNSDEFEREERVPEPETLQRIYRTDLKAINPSVAKEAKGQAIIRLEDDSFEVNIAAQNVPSSIHRQHIHTLSKCPGPEADTNRDGFIDRKEAEVITGPVYLPLDGDLDNRAEDERTYPSGGFLKAYVYREETSRSRLLQDFGRGASFNLEDRVVMIFGAEENEQIPIACGELFRVTGSDDP